jgi:hypothetical protein
LSLGKYVCPLILAGDNGDQTDIFITVEIVDRVRLLQYRSLASWWQTSGCDFGQPCKQADWYIDGTIDTADLMMLSQYWLANSFETFSPTINEGFESGDFSNLAWQHGGDAGWFVDTSSAYEGSFSARSGDIDNSQSSILELTLDTTGWDIDTIDFRVKTSSEQDWDSLYFSIDGQSKGQWSGDSTTWFNASYTISAGVHTYRWVYMKDSDVSLGLDAAWIDSLIFYKK